MNVIYVPSDRQGAGKTAFCSSLALRLAQEGKNVGLYKPFTLSNDEEDSDQDTLLFRSLLDEEDGSWPAHVSTASLSEAGIIERAVQTCKELYQNKDVVIVEGLPGLGLQASGALADALDAQVVPVVRFRHDMKANELIESKQVFGQRMSEILVNGVTRYMGNHLSSSLLPELEKHSLKVLGTVPEDRRLLGVTVGDLAQHLDGRFIAWEEKEDNLVEHLMIGGMILDSGTQYFGLRENKAVMVRGDRPDIQMAALSTPTSCLVLTCGKEPIEYVLYEAEQVEVPIMVVQSDTLSTAKALEGLASRAMFGHPMKLERFGSLLNENVDMPAFISTLGLN